MQFWSGIHLSQATKYFTRHFRWKVEAGIRTESAEGTCARLHCELSPRPSIPPRHEVSASTYTDAEDCASPRTREAPRSWLDATLRNCVRLRPPSDARGLGVSLGVRWSGAAGFPAVARIGTHALQPVPEGRPSLSTPSDRCRDHENSRRPGRDCGVDDPCTPPLRLC